VQRRFRWREIRPDAALLLLIPAALGGFMLYLHFRFGNFMAIRDAQAAWGHGWGRLAWPWEPFVRFIDRIEAPNEFINGSFASVALALIALSAFKLRWSYTVYAVSSYWLTTAWGSFDSLPRYVLPIFPAFIMLALLGRHLLFDRLYLAAAGCFSAFFMMRFALWRWVA
jgi:hypothetical protein